MTDETPETEALEARAATVRRNFDGRAASIREHGLLPDVEQAELAAAWLEASATIDEIREQHKLAEKKAMINYSARAFGIEGLSGVGEDRASVAISFRDAQDRAEQAGSETRLLAVLRKAQASGDVILARACAAVAFQKGWAEVVDQHEIENPGWSALAQRSLEARATQRNQSLARAARFRLPKPQEINGWTPQRMESHRKKVDEQLAAKARERRARPIAGGTW